MTVVEHARPHDGELRVEGGGEPLRTVTFDLQGVRLHVRLAGRDDVPAALLLHCFPDFWSGWRHQIAAFVVEGSA
jgi:hypothetical protein